MAFLDFAHWDSVYGDYVLSLSFWLILKLKKQFITAFIYVHLISYASYDNIALTKVINEIW